MQKLITGVLQLDVQLRNVRPVLVPGFQSVVGHVDAVSYDRVQTGEFAVQILARLVKFNVQLGQLCPPVKRSVQIRPVVFQRDRFTFQINSRFGVNVRQRRQTS